MTRVTGEFLGERFDVSVPSQIEGPGSSIKFTYCELGCVGKDEQHSEWDAERGLGLITFETHLHGVGADPLSESVPTG